MTNTVGSRIATARGSYGLSQAQLGANLGVTRAAVSQYEKDKIRPRPKVIEALAALFNSDPEWFEHGRGSAPDPHDAPVTIHEANVDSLTLEMVDPRKASTGRKWRLPAWGLIDSAHRQMVVIVAPNDAGGVQRGDRVVIDTSRRDGEGVSLIISAEGRTELQLLTESKADAQILGCAVAYLRTL